MRYKDVMQVMNSGVGGNLQILKEFLTTLTDIDETDAKAELTCLSWAVQLSTPRNWGCEMVSYLIYKGADVNPKKKVTFHNLLCCAANTGCIENAKALVDAGVVIECRSYSRSAPSLPANGPPLFEAVAHPEMIQYLIEVGCNPHFITPENNKTLLMHAAEQGYKDSVRVLLNAGVNPELKDDSGNTALDYAAVSNSNFSAEPYFNDPGIVELIEAELHIRELIRQERELAFAMAGHHRLGRDSGMASFDEGLFDIINQHGRFS